jgi:hypothetical protein
MKKLIRFSTEQAAAMDAITQLLGRQVTIATSGVREFGEQA